MPGLTKKQINQRLSIIKRNFSSKDLKLFDKDALVENYDLLFDKNNKLTNEGKAIKIYSKFLIDANNEAKEKNWDLVENRNNKYEETVANMAMGKIELPGQPHFLANKNADGETRCMDQGNYLSKIHNATLLLSNKALGYDKDELDLDKNIYSRIAQNANEDMQRSVENETAYYKELIKIYDNLPEEKSEGFKEQQFNFGVEIINSIAKNHFKREKPGFFARLFRTKSFKEYDTEKRELNQMIDKVNKINTKNYNLNCFKDEESYEDNIDKIKTWIKARTKWPSTVEGVKAQFLIDNEIDKATFGYRLYDMTLDEKLEENSEELRVGINQIQKSMPVSELNSNLKNDVDIEKNDISNDIELDQQKEENLDITMEK